MQTNTLNNTKGYTLIEMLITISLLMILLTATIPQWQLLLHSNELTEKSNQLLNFLYYAKTLAIKQNHNIAVCRKNFYDKQNIQNWSNGLIIINSQDMKTFPQHIWRSFNTNTSQDLLEVNLNIKQYDCLEFTPLGITNGQQGNVNYTKFYIKQQHKIPETITIIIRETGNIYESNS